MSALHDTFPMPRMSAIGRPEPRVKQSRTMLLPDPETTFCETDDGGRLFNSGTGAFLNLDHAACQVWQALGAGAESIRILTERLIMENQTGHWGSRRYVYELIMALISRGHVWVGPAPQPEVEDNRVYLFRDDG